MDWPMGWVGSHKMDPWTTLIRRWPLVIIIIIIIILINRFV